MTCSTHDPFVENFRNIFKLKDVRRLIHVLVVEEPRVSASSGREPIKSGGRERRRSVGEAWICETIAWNVRHSGAKSRHLLVPGLDWWTLSLATRYRLLTIEQQEKKDIKEKEKGRKRKGGKTRGTMMFRRRAATMRRNTSRTDRSRGRASIVLRSSCLYRVFI